MISRLLAVTLLAVVTQAAAVPAFSAMDVARPDRPGDGRDDRGHGNDFISRTLYQRLFGQNVLPLRQLLNLGPEYEGRRVEYVMLTASTDAGQGRAQLQINGANVGPAQQVATWTRDYLMYPDAGRDTLGRDIQALQIHIQGAFNVQSVAVKLSPDNGWGGEIVRVPVNQYYQGGALLNVRQLANLGFAYRGRAVESVTITAKTDFGQGRAALRINGMDQGMSQSVGTRIQDYVFSVDNRRNRLDYDIQALEMSLQGRFTVQSIAVKFARGATPNPPPVPGPVPAPSVVTAQISRDYDGVADLNLGSVMNLRPYDGRRVESVAIYATSAMGQGQAQLLIDGHEASASQTVGRQLENHTFYLNAGSNVMGRDIHDLLVRFRGRFHVETATVTFGR